MNEYYNLNNFSNFNNNESDDLDKLARQINNKKTSLVKKVTNDYNIQQNKWKNGIDNLINNNQYSFLPMNKNNVTNYDNKYQTNNYDISYDISNDISNDNDNYNENDNEYDNFSVNNSLFSSDLIDSESIDLYLDKAKDCKKDNLTNFKNIVNSITYDECSKDDNNIFDHIKKCNTCKNKLIKYLNLTINKETNNDDNNKKIFNFKLNKLEQLSIKEIIVIIMIGIFIIIVLDLLFGLKKK